MTPITAALKRRIKQLLCRTLWKFSVDDLVKHLKKQGLGTGDTLIVHASWRPDSGFNGNPAEMIRALKQVIGPEGLLVMTSMPYQNESSRAFLERGGTLNVRRSPSQMGLLSEVFRRNKETLRSLSPTHPLLAWGAGSENFIAGHDLALSPFGPKSPFQKLLDLDAKVLCIDAPFATITFSHFVEDRIAPLLPFPLYEPQIFTGRVIDHSSEERELSVQVLSAQANRLRRDARYLQALQHAQAIEASTLGNCRLLLLSCRQMVAVAETLYAQGQSFFETQE
ncbi:MAG: aminoglycoside 3-N-acetyltransferase [Motiliproteus sp.]|jgi:aminoglycoside 3-N-acetyltransferase